MEPPPNLISLHILRCPYCRVRSNLTDNGGRSFIRGAKFPGSSNKIYHNFEGVDGV